MMRPVPRWLPRDSMACILGQLSCPASLSSESITHRWVYWLESLRRDEGDHHTRHGQKAGPEPIEPSIILWFHGKCAQGDDVATEEDRPCSEQQER